LKYLINHGFGNTIFLDALSKEKREQDSEVGGDDYEDTTMEADTNNSLIHLKVLETISTSMQQVFFISVLQLSNSVGTNNFIITYTSYYPKIARVYVQ